MTEYRESRDKVIDLLSTLADFRRAVRDTSQEHGNNRAAATKAARELIEAQAPFIQETMLELTYEPGFTEIIDSESNLKGSLFEATQFWASLIRNGFVEAPESGPFSSLGDPVPTLFPPEPPSEITGEAIHDYIESLANWVEKEGEELWGTSPNHKNFPIDLSTLRGKLKGKYAIGDFKQTQFIMEQLKEGQQVKAAWLELANCGNFWDKPVVGSARAKLLFVACDILTKLVNPRTGDSPRSLGGLLGMIM